MEGMMGTDCKVHVEIKDADGVWHHYTTWYAPRNYRLFARMCGVRNDFGIEPIGVPCSAPDDVSMLTAVEIERCNAAFVLSGEHFEQVLDEEVSRHADGKDAHTGIWNIHHRGGAGYLFGNGYKLYGDEGHGFTEVRAICCFD